MAKKFVRGITDVKTINNQDYDTNNVNDLLSDGQYNYIHRKKGKNEEYHNLTDNIKTISSDNTELLSVTNYNKTTNTATLHPKHDTQKEQVLESTRNTVTISHGANGTDEKTTVDTNPEKVLEHENLISNSQYVTIQHEEDSNTSEIKTDKLDSKLVELDSKIPTSVGGRNLALGTSKDWSKPFTGFSGIENTTIELYHVLTNGLSVGDTLKSRIVLKYTDIVPASGQTATIRLQGEGNVSAWDKGNYNATSSKTISGSGELVFEHEFKITADHLKNDYWRLEFRTDWISSGSLQWRLVKFERGMFFTDWSPAPEDIYSHLAQKDQVLESTRDTIAINHGTNGTDEKTTVDTNPEKVLEHEKLKTGDGLGTLFNTDETTIILKPTALRDFPGKNGFYYGSIIKDDAPYCGISLNTDNNKYVQLAFRESVASSGKIVGKYRFINNNVPTSWNEMLLDDASIKELLAQKQNNLTAMGGISITGDSISLTAIDNYSEDLNNLTYTCQAKPLDNAPNLPTGVGGNGVLYVTRVGNVVSQTYHALDNNIYYRITNNSSSTFTWTQWVKVSTTAV